MQTERKRIGRSAFQEQWRRANEEIYQLRNLGLEVVSLTAKAEQRLGSLYEGVMGEEAPDLTELAS